MKDKDRIIIAGGTGFLGSALARHLIAHNCEVIVLTRSPKNEDPKIRQVQWDGATLSDWQWYLDGAKALINLTGRSVDCVPTKENRQAILDSRLDSVRVLTEAVSRCVNPPSVWVQASSLGIYGDTGENFLDEKAPLGTDYMAEVCRQWEQALNDADLPRTRKVLLRIGIVLGPNGGALEPLANLTRLYLGGTAGSGEQYFSWIHVDDFTEMVQWCLDRPKMEGAYNATGPTPATNTDLMQKLRATLERPWCPPAPAFIVKLFARWALKTDSALALTGRRCRPSRFRELGFRFSFTSLDHTLKTILDPPNRPKDTAVVPGKNTGAVKSDKECEASFHKVP